MQQCQMIRTSHALMAGAAIINTIESRQGIGLWVSVMSAVYSGCQCYDVSLNHLESLMHLLMLATRSEGMSSGSDSHMYLLSS
jgi:hypothetical protein